MIGLICFLTWAAIVLFVLGLMMKGERDLIKDRVDALSLTLKEDIEIVAPELTLPFSQRIIRPWLNKTAAQFGKYLPKNAIQNAALKLERAGNPNKLKVNEYIGLKAISLIVFSAAGIGFALFLFNDNLNIRLVIAILGIAVGLLLPDAMLDKIIEERQRLIRKALPDCLDLLVVSAEAGLGFDGALAKVVERMRGPLSDEFKKVLQDMSLGRSRIDALRSMSKRVGISEITTFVAAIHQADMLGVSIAHVLRIQAETLRSNRNIRAREAAAKLPVKMLFPLVFFIFPALFIVVLGPGVFEIYKAFKF